MENIVFKNGTTKFEFHKQKCITKSKVSVKLSYYYFTLYTIMTTHMEGT